MNAFLSIVTGLVVVVGSGLIAIAPIFPKREKRLRWVGVGVTLAGGLLNVVIGLGSAAKTDALVRNTAQIVESSGKTLGVVNETLNTSKDLLQKARENLNETDANLKITSRAVTNLQEASAYTSGGNSFPLVHAEVIPGEGGGQQIGFYFQKEGKYPLHGLRVWVGKPYRRSPTDKSIYYFAGGFGRQWQQLDNNESYTIGLQPAPEEQSTLYSVYMSARNGNWEEVVDVEKVSSGLTIRGVLFGSNDPMVAPNKLISDIADSTFPSSKRHDKIYPLSEIALPIASQP